MKLKMLIKNKKREEIKWKREREERKEEGREKEKKEKNG